MSKTRRSLENTEMFSLMLETARDETKKYGEDGKLSSDAIRSAIFKDILGLENHKDKRFAGRAAAKCQEIFQYIIETIDTVYSDPFLNNPFYQRYVEYKDIAFGEKQGFTVEDDQYFTVSRYSGNHWNTRRQRAFGQREITVPTEWYNVHIYTEFWDFLTGKIDWLSMVRKITTSINKHLMSRIHASFYNAPNLLPPEFVVNGAGVITDEVIDLAEKVRTATGYAPVIAGTKQGLRKLSGDVTDAWVTERMGNEQNYGGVLSMWEGYELMTIPNAFVNGTYKFQELDKLFLLPSNIERFIKVVNEGGQIVRATDAVQGNQDWTLDYNVSFKQGSAIVMGSVYGVYNFS